MTESTVQKDRTAQAGADATGSTGSGARRGQGKASFPMVSGRQRGYRPDQVDDFLARARATYEGAEGESLSAAEVRRTAFPLKRGGYVPRYVDAAMDRLEEVFFERERRAALREHGEEEWWAETRQLLSEVRGRVTRPRGKRFKRRGVFATGYRRSQVDAFLDHIADMFERREMHLPPAEVRDVVFHPQWRGYDEDQVDALLDAVIELILATR